MDDIGAVFREILIRHLNADERYLAADARLVEDLGADSIALFEMVVACEEDPRGRAARPSGVLPSRR